MRSVPTTNNIKYNALIIFLVILQLQIPVRSVTKITKEKTAKIIPNAVGVCTEDEVKHIFASLLSRDTTFKLMTRLWKRTVREAGRILEEEDPDLNLMLQGVCSIPLFVTMLAYSSMRNEE